MHEKEIAMKKAKMKQLLEAMAKDLMNLLCDN